MWILYVPIHTGLLKKFQVCGPKGLSKYIYFSRQLGNGTTFRKSIKYSILYFNCFPIFRSLCYTTYYLWTETAGKNTRMYCNYHAIKCFFRSLDAVAIIAIWQARPVLIFFEANLIVYGIPYMGTRGRYASLTFGDGSSIKIRRSFLCNIV